jgi:hypothetical protein
MRASVLFPRKGATTTGSSRFESAASAASARFFHSSRSFAATSHALPGMEAMQWTSGDVSRWVRRHSASSQKADAACSARPSASTVRADSS